MRAVPRHLWLHRGIALVAVLWMIALLTIMAGSFSLSLQRHSGLIHTNQDRARGLALAEAGVNYALLMLSLPDPHKRWRGDGTPYQVALPGGRARVRIFDEAGKVDLNAAQEASLRALLSKLLDGDADRADALTDAILDWRDPDELTRLHGAEEKEYQAEGKGYVPQNRNFQALEELQMVLGMTPAIYKRLEPVLTIYGGQDGLNPQKASLQALLAIPGVDREMAMQYIAQRQNVMPGVPAVAPPFPPGPVRLTAGGENSYTIFAEAQPAEGQAAGVKAIVRRQRGKTGLPFSFVGWRQQTFGQRGAIEASTTSTTP